MNQYIVLNQIISGINQMIYAVVPAQKVDAMLQSGWMFCLTNGEIGYATEGEAFEVLANFKNQKKKIDLRKAKRTVQMN